MIHGAHVQEFLPARRREKLAVRFIGKKRAAGNLKGLAEAIILQSIEDLWDKNNREESLAFFNGNAFDICALCAGMNVSEQQKIRALLSHSGSRD